MKTKIFALFAAMMLLVGTTAMAQSDNTKTTETELKGDVNNDGVVDVADIAAVIAVMHEQGTVGTPYYWYAGWTEPTEANIGEIINEEYPTVGGSTTNNKAGKTATSISGVTMDYTKNTLYNSAAKINYYVVVPNGQSIYDVLGTNVVSSQFTSHSTFTNHTVYKSTATSRNINAIIIR